jgi:hypothetical protein
LDTKGGESVADDSIKSALLSLTAKTTTGQLREMLPLIEEKLAAGVKHEEILEVLNAHGLKGLTLGSYKTMLYRIRQRAQATTTASIALPAATSQREKVAKVAAAQEDSPALPAEIETVASAGVNPTQALIETEMPRYSLQQMQKKGKG